MASNIYTMLEQMRARPAMYLGVAHISRLRVFLDGFRQAEWMHGVDQDAWPPFDLFQGWTEEGFGWGDTAYGWNNILTEECGGDEVEALRRFYELLDEFRTVQVTRVVQVHLSPDNLAFFHSEACQIRSYYGGGGTTAENRVPPPDTLYVVQFSRLLGCYVYEHRGGKVERKSGRYGSYRVTLQRLHREFGSALHRQELTDLSLPVLAFVMHGSTASII